jgi:hypothetical protein
MARIVYSGIVESIRGSIAGTTFQKNAYGYTVKKKPNIIRPNSPTQNRQKGYMAAAVRQWRAFVDATRNSWDTFASTYPQYSQYNPSAQLSGFAVYTRWACLAQLWLPAYNINQAPVFAVPVDDTLTLGLTRTNGTLNLNVASLTDDESWNVILFASRSLTIATGFVGSKTRFIWGSPQANITGDVDITTPYTNKFGALPANGAKIAIEYEMFAADDRGFVKFGLQSIVTVA